MLCVLMVEGMSLVLNVIFVSNKCDEHTSCLVQLIGAHGGEVMYSGCFCLRGKIGFVNCDICMCCE